MLTIKDMLKSELENRITRQLVEDAILEEIEYQDQNGRFDEMIREAISEQISDHIDDILEDLVGEVVASVLDDYI